MILQPNYIFEVSWEVCNKVGGIYTVLSTHAHSLQKLLPQSDANHVIFIGPDLISEGGNKDFTPDSTLLPEWSAAAQESGLDITIGRWNVLGSPIAILINFEPFYAEKNNIYASAWEHFGVESLQAYGDYDEACMFSYATARLVETIYRKFLSQQNVIYQAHEWMSGMGMLYIKAHVKEIATVFTTHATTVGRSITTNCKQLYKYFEGYNGDQMARELHVEAKHSVEKQAAWHADCFTTVSELTAKECKQLLDKSPDVVLPNGFDNLIVPDGSNYNSLRRISRKKILSVVGALLGERLSSKVKIISTSGRNDFYCKGYDVFLDGMKRLNKKLKEEGKKKTSVIALLEVPCWVKSPRTDLSKELAKERRREKEALVTPFITHNLHNEWEDKILNTIHALGIENADSDPVKVVLAPCYLDGEDGIFNISYYNMLIGSDLCIYPSYYEPWGYTPLEANAFHIPCITTDLSGYGLWVNSVFKRDSKIEDGVEVIHRDDDNYDTVAEEISKTSMKVLNATVREKNKMKRNAATIAKKAEWKNFIKYYSAAYQYALEHNN